MALIICTECGHKISSLARFCPKCKQVKNTREQKPPYLVSGNSSAGDIPVKNISPHNNSQSETTTCEELLHSEFKPSLDEKIILKGRTFLIRGFFDVLDGYAYLTSKRYSFCDALGVNIIFQLSSKGIVSVEEGRHLISKKIIITTVSGETYEIKSDQHAKLLSAFRDPKILADESNKSKSSKANENTSTLDWHYETGGMNVGPVKENVIVQLIQNNHTIFRDTNVWNSTMLEWKRAEETILTIYFSEALTSSEDSMYAMLTPGGPGRRLFPRLKLLCRKYF